MIYAPTPEVYHLSAQAFHSQFAENIRFMEHFKKQ
jgi:hypothetical protein